MDKKSTIIEYMLNNLYLCEGIICIKIPNKVKQIIYGDRHYPTNGYSLIAVIDGHFDGFYNLTGNKISLVTALLRKKNRIEILREKYLTTVIDAFLQSGHEL